MTIWSLLTTSWARSQRILRFQSSKKTRSRGEWRRYRPFGQQSDIPFRLEYLEDRTLLAADLAPAFTTGWDGAIVVSTTTGTNTNATLIESTDNLYIDLGVANFGDTAADPFTVTLKLDGTTIATPLRATPLGAGGFAFDFQDISIGTLADGNHTLQMIIDSGNVVDEGTSGGEDNNITSKTITVGSAGIPDLAPASVGGWDSALVFSTVTGTNTTASTILATDNVYVDLGIANFGTAPADPFTVSLKLDGTTIANVNRTTALGVLNFAGFEDIAIGSLSEGDHTLQMVIDSGNTVDEGTAGGEDNNIISRTFTVGASGGTPDLSPAFTAGWDSPLVISTTTGTNTSAPYLFAGDSLYVDLGVSNFGTAAASPFSVAITLDGATVATVMRTTPLEAGGFAFDFQDIALGILSAGPHTLEMIIDSGNDVDEGTTGGEDNNTFSRTIAVFDPATLRGLKWDDVDGDGVQDIGEDPLGNFIVYLDLNSDGTRDEVDEPFTVTNALGEYEFTNLAPGTYTVSVEYPTSSSRVQTFPGSQDVVEPGFDIDFNFSAAGLTLAQEQLFLDAAAIWESIIVGDLSDMISPDGFFVDDLLIDVFVDAIDGTNGTLGTGGPTIGTGYAHEGTILPSRGKVTLDSADINHAQLGEVIIHEIGHALGIGPLWDNAGLLLGEGTGNPQFLGSEAIAQYNDIFNLAVASVPVESGSGHWRESVLGEEIMTPSLNVTSKLSLITVGSLADLGYEVDYNQADSYRPPGTSLPFVTVDATVSTVGEEGPGTAQFTFTRTDTTSGALTISYTIGGSASAGADYATLSGTATIADGDSSVTIDVIPLSDLDPEGLETVVITVQSGTGYTVGSPRYATITIEDDELVEPIVQMSYTITVRPGETINNLDFGSRVLSANDAPFTEGVLGDVAVDEDAVSTVVDLFAAFGDVEDADAALTFSVTGNTNLGLFASLAIDGVAGTLTLDYAANVHGSAILTVEATDTGGLSVEQTFTVTVNPINDAPTATTTTLNTNEDTAVELDLWTLVADIETADAALVFTVSNAVNGSVELLADGHTARFTPTSQFNGAAAFDYDVTDNGDGSATAITVGPLTIDVNVAAVNDAPTATTTTLNTNEDIAVEIDLWTLAADIETPDADLVFSVSNAVNGSVELLADGHTARFTPTSQFNGAAAFDYDVTDSGDGSAAAITVGPLTIAVNVAAVNDTPTATTTTLNTNEDTAVELDLWTLVDDIETADADLVFTVSNAVNGSVELLADGHTARFTPTSQFNGAAAFDYDVTDNGDGSAAAINVGPLTIGVNVAAVNDAPTATTTTLNTNEDTAVEVDLWTLVADIETPDADLVFSVSNAVNGSVELLADGHTARFTPTSQFNGAAAFDYDVTDSGDGASPAINVGPLTIGVNVGVTNDAPFTEGVLGDVAVDEDAVATVVDLFAAFGDVEDADAALTFSVTGNTNLGLFASLAIDGVAGTLTLDYAANVHGSAILTVEATDTGGLSVEQTFTVTVNPINDAPTATTTTLNTNEDTAVELDLWTLVSDIETTDAALTFSVSNAVNGSVELLADGHTARFTPTSQFNGAAAFDYDVTDNGDGSAAAINVGPLTIGVNVAAVNDTPTATMTTLNTNEDTAVELDLWTLVSDVETADANLSFSVSNAVNGSVELLANGHTARFTPTSQFNGAAAFDYDVTDSGDGSVAAITVGPLTIAVNVAAVNDTPTATTTTLNTNEDTAIELDLWTLVDDIETTDADLVFSVSNAVNGSVELLADGHTARFTPTSQFNGAAAFDYSVTDSGDGSAAAITVGPLTIGVNVAAVNDATTATTTTLNTNEDTAVELDLWTLVADIETPDADLVFSVSNAVNGSVELLADGHTARFTPTSQFNGAAAFDYDVTDSGDGSAAAITVGPLTIGVNVAAVNDAPTATTTTLNTNEDTAVELDLWTLVDDIETTDAALVFSVSNAVNGSVELLADGHTARFTPTSQFNGAAAFDYDVTDNGDGSATAITVGPLTIDVNVAAVNDAPTATTTTLNTNEDTAIELDLWTLVSDIETTDAALTFSVSNAVNGSVELLADGHTARFTPTSQFNGAAAFDYDVTDSGDGSVAAITVGPLTIAVNVAAVNDTPTAVTTTLNTNEDTAVEVDLWTLVDDIETPDADLVFSVSNAVNGSVELLADGHTARFTPASQFNGAAAFDYVVTDSGDGSATAITVGPLTIAVNVGVTNDAPFTEGVLGDVAVDEDAVATVVDLFAAFGDVEDADAALTFSVTGNTNLGLFASLAIDGVAGTLTLDYAANVHGSAILTVEATDTGGLSVEQTFTVTVNPINDTPTAAMTTLNTNEDTAVELDLWTLVADIETTDAALVFSVSNAVNGTVELLADGHTARFTPTSQFNGAAAFDYNVIDSGDGSAAAITVGPLTIAVNVAAVNDAPTATTTTLNTNEDTAVELDLWTLVADIETADADLVFTVSNAVNGSVELLADGHTARFTPTSQFNGAAAFDYDVTDSGDGSAAAITVGPLTIAVNVGVTNDAPFTEGVLGDVTVDEDAVATVVDLFAAFGDVEDADAALTFAVTGNTNLGLFASLAIDGVAGTLTLDYAANVHGSAILTVEATDTGGLSVEQTFTVTVNPINDAPTATTTTTINTNEDTAVELDLWTLVADIETADAALVFSVSNAVNGTVELLADGHTARFTPTSQFNGAAAFDYDVTDSGDGSVAAITVGPLTIGVNVTAVNDAPTATTTTLNTNEDTAVEIDLWTLVADIETPDADLVFSVSNAVNGTVELLADGHTARFTPTSQFNGAAAFDYDVTDSGDASATAINVGPLTIGVNVTAVNDPPTAATTTLNTNEDTAVELDLWTLVADIETADADLVFTVSNAVNGSVELLADGHTARFTPTSQFNGAAAFDYDVTDNGDGSATAINVGPLTIAVNVAAVNDAPTATTTTLNTNEDIAVEIDLWTLVADIETPDADLVFSVSNAVNGSVELLADGHTARFTPTSQFNGASAFDYDVTDSGDGSAAAITVGPLTIGVNVAAVNDATTATTTTLNTNEDTAVELDLWTLVSDIETTDAALTFSVSNAVNGSVELLADGHTARFTPTSQFNGAAAFDYDVTDSGDGSVAAITVGPLTIAVNVAAVNDTPTAVTTTLNTNEDTAVELDLWTLVADIETPDADLVFSVSNAVNGSVELLADGHTARFTPTSQFNGAAAFDYDVTDSGDGSAAAITVGPLTIGVNVAAVNDAPTATTTTLNTNEDTAVELDLWTLVADIETADADLVFSVSNAVNGSVELLADGHTARFTPTSQFNGAAAFDYDVTDSGDGASPAINVGPLTIGVNVAAVNDAPTATTTTLNTNEDTAIELDLWTLVDDIETTDAALIFSVSNAVNGNVELLADGHTARFTPTSQFNGAAAFDYVVTDSGDGSATAINVGPLTIGVNVTAVNDTPTAATTTLNTNEDTAVELDLWTLVADIETADADLVFTVSNAVNGSVELLADGHTARFTPTSQFNGAAAFDYDVTDSGDGASPAINIGPLTIAITVAPVQDLPALALQLEPSFDSGTFGDHFTNISIVTLVGTTDLNQVVLLDMDGDGFDDGSVNADALGSYQFSGIELSEGEQTIRVQASNSAGTAEVSLAITLDTQSPEAELITPADGSEITAELGYIDVQWTSVGLADLDMATFDTNDVTVSGVDVDRIEFLGAGLVRYWYNDDGDSLTYGNVSVVHVAGEVQDIAGNANQQNMESFTFVDSTGMVLQVVEVIVNDGDAQRSNIEKITIHFNQATNLQELIDSGQITQAVKLLGEQYIALAVEQFEYDADTFTLTIDLTEDGFGDSQKSILDDGSYELKLDTRLITELNIPTSLLLDDDGQDDFFRDFDFHSLLGDFDGDADIDRSDRELLFAHLGSSEGDPDYDYAFDLTGDGEINRFDYYFWFSRYFRSWIRNRRSWIRNRRS